MSAPDLSAPVHSEADVETRRVIPILRGLGWQNAEIHSKVRVAFQTGTKRGRPHEADFVLAAARPSPPTSGLVVVEVKRPDESLDGAADQALSYAVALRAALFCTCNGNALQVWQWTWGAPARLVFNSSIANISADWGQVERLLSRSAVDGFYKALAPERVRVGDFDVTTYLGALQADVSGTALCDRTAKTSDTESVAISATRPAVTFVDGCCIAVTGSGGRGKSSALALVIHAQLRQLASGASARVPIRLRASEIDQRGVYMAIADELRGSVPELSTPSVVQAWMRTTQTLVLFDDWERATDEGRAEVRRFIRDANSLPCATVVAARDEVVAAPKGAVELRLAPLSEDEQRQFAVVLRPDVEWDNDRLKNLVEAPPYSIRPLLREPVVLATFLKLTSVNGRGGADYPRDLPALLDEVLRQSVSRNHSKRREKTHELIEACCELARGPRPFSLKTLQAAVRSVASSWDADELLGELQDVGIISPRHSTFDFSHDLWRIHFQTKERYRRVVSAADVASWLTELEADLELAIPFVAALVDQAEQQQELFRRLAERDIALYCKGLLARATTLEAQAPGWELRVVTTLRETYASLVNQLCPNLRAFLDPWRTDGAQNPLSIVGSVDPGSLSYALSAPPPERNRPTVVLSQGDRFMDDVEANAVGGYDVRSHNLALLGWSTDCAYEVATERLITEAREAIVTNKTFLEAEWFLREECWEAVADLVSTRQHTTSLTVSAFIGWLHDNANKVGPRYVQYAVALLERLSRFGLDQTLVSELPLPQPDRPAVGRFRTGYSLERRCQRTATFFNAVVKTYREICERYLPGFGAAMAISSYPAKPHVYIVRLLSEYEWDATWWWEPVQRWEQTDAAVYVVDDRSEEPSRDQVRAAVAQARATLNRGTTGLGLTNGRIGSWAPKGKDVTEKVKRMLDADFTRLQLLARGRR